MKFTLPILLPLKAGGRRFIDRHGHDMSVEQKKLHAKVDKVIEAYEEERAALRKLSEKIDEGQ